ncbi:uncharacterized protein LOC115305084 [Suricata suricatta]|uniref:uncharacterized protein LOC115305084 n=1 Tax=Suricata suricatta TaxID=37032 RepID=UPI001155DE60|nr:uncharacterized protein LOC115305084 [Suricata suricatta]
MGLELRGRARGSRRARAASAASNVPLESPKRWRPRGQYCASKSGFLPPPPPLRWQRPRSGSGFLHPCAEQLGVGALRWRRGEAAPETTSRCARLAGLPLASSCSALRAPRLENKAAREETIPNWRRANSWRVNFHHALGLRYTGYTDHLWGERRFRGSRVLASRTPAPVLMAFTGANIFPGQGFPCPSRIVCHQGQQANLSDVSQGIVVTSPPS